MSVSLGVVPVMVSSLVTGVGVLTPDDPVGHYSPGGGWKGVRSASPSVRGAHSRGLGYHCRPYVLGDDLQWWFRGRFKLSPCFQFTKVGRMCFLNLERAVAPSVVGTHVQVVASGWSIQVTTHARFVFPNEAGLFLLDPGKQYILSNIVRVSWVTNMSVVAGGVEVGEREDGIGLRLHVVFK